MVSLRVRVRVIRVLVVAIDAKDLRLSPYSDHMSFNCYLCITVFEIGGCFVFPCGHNWKQDLSDDSNSESWMIVTFVTDFLSCTKPTQDKLDILLILLAYHLTPRICHVTVTCKAGPTSCNRVRAHGEGKVSIFH